MDICLFECRVLSGRGLCNELITRPEESYRLCCVAVCDLETSRIGAPYIYDISSLRVKQVLIWRKSISIFGNSLKIIIFSWNKWGTFDIKIFHICVLGNNIRIVYLITVHPVRRIYCFNCRSDSCTTYSVHSKQRSRWLSHWRSRRSSDRIALYTYLDVLYKFSMTINIVALCPVYLSYRQTERQIYVHRSPSIYLPCLFYIWIYCVTFFYFKMNYYLDYVPALLCCVYHKLLMPIFPVGTM